MRKTINLDKISSKIYRKINKLRPYGWLSRDVQELLKSKYGVDKEILTTILNEKQKQRNRLDDEIRDLAKKINKIKDSEDEHNNK